LQRIVENDANAHESEGAEDGDASATDEPTP
jgi:hypothetical protein